MYYIGDNVFCFICFSEITFIDKSLSIEAEYIKDISNFV